MNDTTSTREATTAERVLVAFDPGKNVGVAYVSGSGELLRSLVTSLAEVSNLEVPSGATVLVGSGTARRSLMQALQQRGLEPRLVDERSTTLEARALYFRDNPPRGLAKLIPRGMLYPPRDIDDYAAYAIALSWLANESG